MTFPILLSSTTRSLLISTASPLIPLFAPGESGYTEEGAAPCEGNKLETKLCNIQVCDVINKLFCLSCSYFRTSRKDAETVALGFITIILNLYKRNARTLMPETNSAIFQLVFLVLPDIILNFSTK